MKRYSRLIIYAVFLVGFLIFSWYKSTYKNQSIQNLAPENTGSVVFIIQEISSVKSQEGETKRWLATYSSGGKHAYFHLELLLKEPSATTNKLGIIPTKGTFYHEANSDNSQLVTDLAKALEATEISKQITKTNSLPFTATILGTNLSKELGSDVRAGSFTSNPKGGWTALKAFVADGQGEFYLAIDSVNKKGEISIKDPEYGNIVLRELVKVL